MRQIWIVGYRDFGIDVSEIAASAGYSIAGFIDYEKDNRFATSSTGNVVSIESVDQSFHGCFVCAMTSTLLRRTLAERISVQTNGSLAPGKACHPQSTCSDSAIVAEGTIISAQTAVAAGARLGRFNLVNRGATIGHHTQLNDYCTVGPGVNIGGNCTFGEHVYVGIGATVLNRIRIGRQCLIGAGAVVTKDVPDRTLVMGVPARVIRRDFPGR